MYQRHRRGESHQMLARRYGLRVASVRKVLAEAHYRRLSELPLDYIPNEEFKRMPAARRQQVLGPPPALPEPAKRVRPPAGLPPYLSSLYEVPLLSREQEVHLFRKMNYLKYRASSLLAKLDPEVPDEEQMEEIEALYQEAVAVKNEIIRANLRLVVSIAKRYASSSETLFELVSDGNISLIRAVEKFDYGRGFKFSTYATWAIIKNFARTIPTEHRYHTRFRTGGEEMFQAAPDQRSDHRVVEAAHARRESQIAHIMRHLDERERQIIRFRYGLEPGHEPMTLKEVGSAMGVTKERIRQLETRAIAKLRKAAEEEGVEVPDNSI